MKADPRILVAVIGETRAHELTAAGFRKNLLEPLAADLALCVRGGTERTLLHEWSDHLLEIDEPEDCSELYDDEAGGPEWRTLLEIRPGFLGGIEGGGAAFVGRIAIGYYYRRRLWRWLRETGIADLYDWIVVTRSDFLWPLPHPHPRYLSDRHLHLLDGEEYGGICDRHLVVPRRYFKPVLGDLVDPLFTDPEGARTEIERVSAQQEWPFVNSERYLALRLRAVGLWSRIRHLPYIPYTVRAPNGPTNWSVGVFDEDAGYYVKYPTERERSRLAGRFIRDQDSWPTYLAPIRGARQRRSLRRTYREHGLYERAFTRKDAIARVLRRAAHKTDMAAGRVGHQLRKAPVAPALLDARLRRIRSRQARRAS